MRRRALRVMPPAKEKDCRRRVLAVASGWPRARRPVQWARFWAKTWTASQALFGKLRVGGEAPRGEMVEAHPVLEVADGVLNLGVAAMVSLQLQRVAISIGDEGVIQVCVD